KRVTRTMELSGLDIYFGDRLFTASQVKNGKPAPDLFLLAAEMLNVPRSSCLVIEDSIPGVVAAQAAGMEVWWFNGGCHLHGMNRQTHKELRGVKSFDNWAHFFDMAPELKKQTSKLPEVNEQPTR
ncbi:MAG: HAD-IA family hydrolase, partial [Pseudomonadota bacterium]